MKHPTVPRFPGPWNTLAGCGDGVWSLLMVLGTIGCSGATGAATNSDTTPWDGPASDTTSTAGSAGTGTATDGSTSESSDGEAPSTLSSSSEGGPSSDDGAADASSSSDASDESEGSPMLDCSDPDVIFCDDFESGVIAPADGGQWSDCGTGTDKITQDVAHSGKRAFHFKNDVFAPCYFHDSSRMSDETELYLRFYWLIPYGFDFARIGGGGHTWRFYEHYSSAGGQMDSGFSCNTTPDALPPDICQDDNDWGNSWLWLAFHDDSSAHWPGCPDPSDHLFGLDSWNKFEFYVRLNNPGAADGQVRVWVNGHPRYEEQGLSLQDDTSVGYDTFALVTNYDRISAACPDKRQDWYIDDVFLSRSIPEGAFTP